MYFLHQKQHLQAHIFEKLDRSYYKQEYYNIRYFIRNNVHPFIDDLEKIAEELSCSGLSVIAAFFAGSIAPANDI